MRLLAPRGRRRGLLHRRRRSQALPRRRAHARRQADAAEAKELEGLVKTMVDLEYLSMDEVPSIPTRKEPFGVAVYAPARSRAAAARRRARARQRAPAHAARRGGAGRRRERSDADDGTADLRARCPRRSTRSSAGASLGCIGNRVYTGARRHRGLLRHPGRRRSLRSRRGCATIVHANDELEKFHRARAQS